MTRKLDGSLIQSGTITSTQLSPAVANSISAGGGPRVTSLIYPGNDTAGNTVGGQTVYINGSGFETNNAIYINGNAVPSKSFISASNLSFTTPALSAGIYPVYVINTDNGATAIFVPGYITSAEPSWVSTASIAASETWSIALSATGDAPITYALAGGSSLPGGISLAANGLISGTLSSPPETDTQYTFTVVASDAQNQDASRQFTVTVSTGEGALFANNVLLIHADGTNNQNNHHFLDSSNNNFTITRNGNPSQGSFSPFSQTGWSNYFDGSGDSLNLSYSTSAFDWWTSDYTIEAWVYSTNLSTWSYLDGGVIITPGMIGNASRTDTTNYWSFGPLSNGTVRFKYYNGASVEVTSSATITNNTWNHIAMTKTSSGIVIWVNGVGTSAAAVSGTPQSGTGTGLSIGQINNTSITGYISNLRILKGTALYTSAFTPPTSPLTAIANTSLLTCQSNRFIDNSTNAFTLTRNGDVSVQAFSPFAPTDAYTTANVGGSGYFDGTVDNLVITSPGSPMDFGTGDFTIDFWVYSTVAGAQRAIISSNNASWETGSAVISGTGSGDGLRMRMGVNGTVTIADPNNFQLNTWNYYMFTRSGTNFNLYKNGTRVATASGSGTVNFGNNNGTKIGGGTWDGESSYITGYISGLRALKGAALFAGSTCDVPTAPLTNIANTSLLCNFTNAGIFDQTAKNVLETVGDAKVSTAQYKYGTGSMYFDGTGDYLVTPSSVNLQYGLGDFTIEFWWYPTTLASVQVIFYHTNDSGVSGTGEFAVIYNTSLGIRFYYNGGAIDINQGSTSGWSANNWYHVAIARYGNTLTIYRNGVSVASGSVSGTTIGANVPTYIGGEPFDPFYMTGYIDDLRITKGYARYTTNFTPPTSALKDK